MAAFVGIVLAGGQSTRMGHDKVLVEVEGRPMAARVADALRQAGATTVLGVGGDPEVLRGLGLEPVADEYPRQGPLGGLLTGLRAAGPSVTFVAACDLPWLDPPSIRAVVDALEGSEAEVAAPDADGRTLFLCAAYRPAALQVIESAFEQGERAVHRAASRLSRVAVDGIDPRTVRDVDTPQDLGSVDRPR